jgi:hypothetical protein
MSGLLRVLKAFSPSYRVASFHTVFTWARRCLDEYCVLISPGFCIQAELFSTFLGCSLVDFLLFAHSFHTSFLGCILFLFLDVLPRLLTLLHVLMVRAIAVQREIG